MMTQNRRSTPQILRCAYHAIARNPEITSLELNDNRMETAAADRRAHLARTAID